MESKALKNLKQTGNSHGMNTEKQLKQIFFDCQNSSACFAGIDAIVRECKKRNLKVSKAEIIKFLSNQNVYTKHKPIIRRFLRNKTVPLGYMTDWQADLCDMQKLSNKNSGYKYILTCIDVFSRLCFAEPLLSKKPQVVVKGFKKIIKSSKRKCWRLFTDSGGEFVNAVVKKYLEKIGVKHLVSRNADTKAAIVERLNKNIKNRLWRYFTYSKSENWIKILPHIIRSINHSYNRSINARPIDITIKDELKFWNLLHKKTNHAKAKFSIGDRVRISKHKSTFAKGYLPNFTTEIFTVIKVLKRNPIVYKIKDSNNEIIDGVFYDKELVKVLDSSEIFEIEKVLKTRSKKGIKQAYVKWKGYDRSFNQWISADEIVKV